MEHRLVLDGNAVAGDLEELFGMDLTAVAHRCAHCGNRGAVATCRAYLGGPGVVLRCSVCHEIVVRWARTPTGTHIDLRGVAELRLVGGPSA